MERNTFCEETPWQIDGTVEVRGLDLSEIDRTPLETD
jgi:hypothetical protein